MVAGIDVGKANLDVSVSGGPVLRFQHRNRHPKHGNTGARQPWPSVNQRTETSRLTGAVVHPGRVPLSPKPAVTWWAYFPNRLWEPETDPQRARAAAAIC